MSAPNGYRVRVEVRDVPLKGKGIVALEPIRAGQLIWTGEDARVQETLDEAGLRARVASMASHEDIAYFLNHIYCYGGVVCALHDTSKFTNHSKRDPVMATAETLRRRGIAVVPFGREPVDELDCFAGRDVAVGEEITDDYSNYENPPFYVELCKQFNVEWAGLVVEKYSD